MPRPKSSGSSTPKSEPLARTPSVQLHGTEGTGISSDEQGCGYKTPVTTKETGFGVEIRNASRHNPLSWKCQGCDDQSSYIYFDGAKGSADRRFLIDLATNSMERLRDIRPYFYHFGFWRDITAPCPPPGLSDHEIEELYVKSGREYLMSEWIAGRGYFAADRNWEELDLENLGAMPWECCKYDPIPGDVGCEEEHPDDPHARLHGVFKTNMRIPMPDQEVMTLLAYEKWEIFVLTHYYDHPFHKIVNSGYSAGLWRHEMASDGVANGYLIEEARYLYHNPYGIWPVSIRPPQARELMERQKELLHLYPYT